MISKIEMHRDSMRLVADKIERSDNMAKAIDDLAWKAAVKAMNSELKHRSYILGVSEVLFCGWPIIKS